MKRSKNHFVVRLWFNGKKKYIGLIGTDKKETKYEITSLDDIYKYSNELGQTVDLYLNEK